MSLLIKEREYDMRLRNIPRADSVLAACPFVIKEPYKYCGKWNTDVFKNENPVHIEIGMGKGQFLLTLAAKNPQINYIGIERYSSVLLRAVERLNTPLSDGSVSCADDNINNIRFLCVDAAELPQIFSSGEVSLIYLNFSDPWPKARHARRRLTSKEYFTRYDAILTADGLIEFKTDNRNLFDFSVEQLQTSKTWQIIACTYDLHQDSLMNTGNIMTEYEAKFSSLGNPICKLTAARLP